MAESREELTTPVDNTFSISSSLAGKILVSGALAPIAPHLFSTRQLEFLSGSIDNDYARVAGHFRVLPDRVMRVRQVHGRVVVVVRPGEEWPDVPEADAIVSLDPARVASVRVADCVPLLIADRHHRVVAAVHAGWRGTAARVSEAVVDRLAELGVPSSDLVVAVGPAIGSCCYQVDAQVRAAFESEDAARWFASDAPDHWRLDLATANRDQLVARGVPAAQVSMCGFCTFHDREHWHSFRRDGSAAGRMVAAIRLRSPLAVND